MRAALALLAVATALNTALLLAMLAALPGPADDPAAVLAAAGLDCDAPTAADDPDALTAAWPEEPTPAGAPAITGDDDE